MTDDSLYKSQKEEIRSDPPFGVFDRSRKKSSRSKADLFELLLTQELNKYYKLSYSDLKKDIKETINKILDFKDGLLRIKEQQKRISILFPFLIKEIDKLIPMIGKPVMVSWVGRKWKINKTLSDINIKFSSRKNIGISTKSTRSGKGTQKNIGEKGLRNYLGLSIKSELKEMKNKIIAEVIQQGNELKKIAKKGIGSIRKNKYTYQIIQSIGKKHGINVQKIAVEKSVECFNNLTIQRKKDFVIYILGSEEINPLLNAFAIGNRPVIFWGKKLDQIASGRLRAEKEGNKGYVIFSNNKKIIRVQANFTNGIGISPFCERAFLLLNLI